MEDRIEAKIEEKVNRQLKKLAQTKVIEQRIKLPQEVVLENLERLKAENNTLIDIIEIWSKRLDKNSTPVPRKGDRSALLLELQEKEKQLIAKTEEKKKRQVERANKEIEHMKEVRRQELIQKAANDRFVSFVDCSIQSYQLQTHLGNLESELNRLERYSYLDEIYRIEYRENFALVNGIKMGSDCDKPADFSLEDTCFGFGHLLQLVTNIIRRLNLEIKNFKVAPKYNRSMLIYEGTDYYLYPHKLEQVTSPHDRPPTTKASFTSRSSSKKSGGSSRRLSIRLSKPATLSSAPICSRAKWQIANCRPKTSSCRTSCRIRRSEGSTCASILGM